MIILALIIYFLYFYFASSSPGSSTNSLINFERSFSSRLSPILYFQARKFYIPSNLSSSLLLGDILSRRSENDKKLKFLRNENCTHQNMCLIEASMMVQSVSEESKFWPLKLDLQDSGLQFFAMFLVFWFQDKLGLEFWEDIPIKKLQSWCQNMHLGWAHFPMSLALKKSTLLEIPNFCV